MKSVLYRDEVRINTERKFGSSDTYFPCRIVDADGNEMIGLFTGYEIDAAIERGVRNPEDVYASGWERLWGKLFG